MFYFSTFFFLVVSVLLHFQLTTKLSAQWKKSNIFGIHAKIVELTNEYYDKEIRSLVFENWNACYVIEEVLFS